MKKLLRALGTRIKHVNDWIISNVGADLIISLLLFSIFTIIFISIFGWINWMISVSYVVLLFVCFTINFRFDERY